jgi:integrase
MKGRDDHDGSSDRTSEALLPLPIDLVLRRRPAAWLIPDSKTDRAAGDPCLIQADDDLQAIEVWLAEYATIPNTIRAYKRDIARFYSWMVLLQHKPLSSVTPEDLHQYDSFLANPPKDWCAPRSRPRTAGDWYPFEGALLPVSRQCTLVGVASCFAYLASVGYLAVDPFQRWHTRPEKRPDRYSFEKRLSLTDFASIVRALEVRAETAALKSHAQRLKAERELFVVSILGNTGLRRDELPRMLISDIRQLPDPSLPPKIRLLYVSGDGKYVDEDTGELISGDRLVVLTPGALAAIERYRSAVETYGLESNRDSPILQPLRKRKFDCCTGNTVYNIVFEAIRSVRAFYEKSDPRMADLAREVTPQQLRYTFELILQQFRADPELIQAQLGCVSAVDTLSPIVDETLLDLIQTISRFYS